MTEKKIKTMTAGEKVLKKYKVVVNPLHGRYSETIVEADNKEHATEVSKKDLSWMKNPITEKEGGDYFLENYIFKVTELSEVYK